MLLDTQREYLESLSANPLASTVRIEPHNPGAAAAAARALATVRSVAPDVDVRFMGSAALGVCGQNDVDLYLLSPAAEAGRHVAALTEKLGALVGGKWRWQDEGVEITLCVRAPETREVQEQLAIFDLFRSNPQVLREYDLLKQSLNGKTYLEYQTAKYEFYNRALGIDPTTRSQKTA